MFRRTASRLDTAVNRWLLAPQPNAAGSLGVFRVVYCLFYLWHLSFYFGTRLAGLPIAHQDRLLLLAPLDIETFPPVVFVGLEAGLVGALVLLLFGLRVRIVTAAVLVLGGVYEAFWISLDGEHSPVLLTFHIPLFMLLVGGWGDTYSLDALLRRRSGRGAVEPSDPSGRYVLPVRAVLVVLVFLFTTGAVLKLSFGGTWLYQPDLTSNLMLEKNMVNSVFGLWMNPLAPAISENATVASLLQHSIILFEGTVFLALFDAGLRRFVLAMAVVFHGVNALWLGVSFTAVLIVYALFVDWQSIRDRVWPRRMTALDRVPGRVLVLGAIAGAATAAALWNAGPGLRNVANLGGLLDWRTVFFVVLPIALVVAALAARDLLRRSLRWRASRS